MEEGVSNKRIIDAADTCVAEATRLKGNDQNRTSLQRATWLYMAGALLYHEIGLTKLSLETREHFIKTHVLMKMLKKRDREELDKIIELLPKRLKTILPTENDAVNKVKDSLIELKKLL